MHANGVECKDPFLAALLAPDIDIAEERFREESRLAEEYSSVEIELQKRAEATSQYMQQVLELVRVSLSPRIASCQTSGPQQHQCCTFVGVCRCYETKPHLPQCSPQTRTLLKMVAL